MTNKDIEQLFNKIDRAPRGTIIIKTSDGRLDILKLEDVIVDGKKIKEWFKDITKDTNDSFSMHENQVTKNKEFVNEINNLNSEITKLKDSLNLLKKQLGIAKNSDPQL